MKWKLVRDKSLDARKNNKYLALSVKNILQYTIAAMMSALTFALKIAFAFIPNVEFVTFFLMLSMLFFRFDIGFLIINLFCFFNMMFFGTADWSIMYFIIFNIYGVIILILRKIIFRWWWMFIIVVAVMGYVFGFLYALQSWVIYDLAYAISYYIAGITFDLIHGTANGIITLILFIPLFKCFALLKTRYDFLFNRAFNQTTLIKKTKETFKDSTQTKTKLKDKTSFVENNDN